jgi:hypothetical protein
MARLKRSCPGVGRQLTGLGASRYYEVLAPAMVSDWPGKARLANQRLAALSRDFAFARAALFSRARLWHKIGDYRGTGSRQY